MSPYGAPYIHTTALRNSLSLSLSPSYETHVEKRNSSSVGTHIVIYQLVCCEGTHSTNRERDVMYAPYVVKELTRRRSKTTTVVLTVAVIIVMVITSTTVMNAYSSAIYLPFKSSGSDIILQKADTMGQMWSREHI